MKNKQIKYNASEVRITRCVVALFLYLAMMGSIWCVRRLYREVDFLVVITAGLLIAVSVVTGILYRRQKKAGVDFERTVWGMDYWFYLSLSAASAHSLLMLTRPVEFWTYTAPIIYVMLLIHYVLYVAALDQGKNFTVFGLLCATAGLGMMGMYQTYYNSKQLTIPTRILSHADAYTVGWLAIAVAAIVIVLLARRKKESFWKQLGTVGIFAAYWGMLQLGWGSGFIITMIGAGVLTAWFIVLRILRQIKVIS